MTAERPPSQPTRTRPSVGPSSWRRILSIVATLVAGAALAVVLVRGSNQPPGGHDRLSHRHVVRLFPSASALPVGLGPSPPTRFLVERPDGRPSSGRLRPARPRGQPRSISVSCYGVDAELAFARDHEFGRWRRIHGRDRDAAGRRDSGRHEPARWAATRSSSAAEPIVADITAPTTLDLAVLQSVAVCRRRGDEPGALREPTTLVGRRRPRRVGVSGRPSVGSSRARSPAQAPARARHP